MTIYHYLSLFLFLVGVVVLGDIFWTVRVVGGFMIEGGMYEVNAISSYCSRMMLFGS